jgi:hypothetical protein
MPPGVKKAYFLGFRQTMGMLFQPFRAEQLKTYRRFLAARMVDSDPFSSLPLLRHSFISKFQY